MRTVHADFVMHVDREADFELLLLPSAGHDGLERLVLELDGAPVDAEEVRTAHGTRALRFVAGPGRLACAFDAEVAGRAPTDADEDPAGYLAASRYVEVEELAGFASERFGRATGWDAVDAVVRHVARSLAYDMTLSEIDDGAVATLRKGGGMCRDHAHVVIGLCRALGIPARYASVYAPALSPQDFHAVAEVHLDGAWWVVDATHLAPRASMLRIATGVDAEATAWATNSRGRVELEHLRVAAADDALEPGSIDDRAARVRLS